MRKLTQEEFIEQCIEKHSGKYDYSLVVYKNTRSKVKIICPDHGQFEQGAKQHKDGQGCPKCYHIKLTVEGVMVRCDEFEYINVPTMLRSFDKVRIKSIIDNLVYEQDIQHHIRNKKPINLISEYLPDVLSKIHGGRYEYFFEDRVYNKNEKVLIKDTLTGDEFMYRLNRHLKGMRPNKVTRNVFLHKSKEIHGDRYDYSNVGEINANSDKVSIICSDHGSFTQSVNNHMNLGDNCPYCVGSAPLGIETIIDRFRKTHSNRYDYSHVELSDSKYMVEIICPDHGSFVQNIYKHISGQGCPECSWNSKGEEYVKEYLDEFGIKYIRQHGFDDCKYINKLNFDFYLPELNTCIEFDGVQHYKPVSDFGGVDEFKIIQKRDMCKNKWCVENGIKLIRIKYNQMSEMKEILKNNLM
jgi:protein-arginine kinase activator protein McsA